MAPSPEARTALARRGVELYQAGDVEGVLALLHPQVEGFSEGPNTGGFDNHDGFLRWASEWDEAWESFERKVRDVEVVGERHAVAIVHQTGRGRDSGIEVEQLAAYVFEIDDEGRCVYLGLFLDLQRGVEAARERERSRE